MDLWNYLVSVAISLAVGLAGFVITFKVFDWLTPRISFSEQLNSDNKAVAIFLAGLFIGLGILVGMAVQ